MSHKKSAGRATALLLLALCPLLGGCGRGTSPAASDAGADESLPSAEVTAEEPAAAEKPVWAESLPAESIPEESIPEQPLPSVPDDPALFPILEEIQTLAVEYELSVAYLSGDGAYRYSVDGDRLRSSASTIKAMYCQYLLASGVDWGEPILFDRTEALTSSSGALTEDKLGSTFTVGELIGYAIRYSDNMAYRLLFDTYGAASYNAWVQELGVPGLQITSASGYANVRADDLARGMLEILRYSQTDDKLVELLRAARRKALIAAGTQYAVASKYGYQTDTTEYHEAAIVFAPAPYVLTVMSQVETAPEDMALPFAGIAKLVEQLNALLFPS